MLVYANAHRYARSRALFEEASKLIPGGVNSTARATWSGWEPHPIFVDHGEGAHLVDVDGNRYVDYLLGLGPMLLGHRPAKVTKAVIAAIEKQGTMFALPAAEETKLARKIVAAVPSLDQVRLCNTGTEAVLYAVRLARAFTGRDKVIRFEGMYHGFSDGVYWSKHPPIAGSQERPVPVPQGPGMPKDIERSLIILNWNDIEGLKEAIAREGADIAAVLTEPVMCNTGCILPEPGYLEAMRELCASAGIVLIFDEVITGFRLGFAGAQGHYGITPDLSIFAKGVGGGFPVAAMGGRRDIMALVAQGKVSMAGTYSANTIAVAAANATLDALAEPGAYDGLHERSEALMQGLSRIMRDARLPAFVVGVGPVLQLWFSKHPIRNYRDAARHADHAMFRKWWEGMLDRGILFHPGAYENLFLSFAHTKDDIEETLAAAREVAKTLAA